MSLTMLSLHSCKIKTLISSWNHSTHNTIFTHVNTWTLLKLLSYSFSFIRICTLHRGHFFILSHTIMLISLHSVIKSLKTDFEHSNVSWQQTTFYTLWWLHSFIFCVLPVKYCVSKLFLLVVRCAHMYVLLLNGNCIWTSHNNSFDTEYFT